MDEERARAIIPVWGNSEEDPDRSREEARQRMKENFRDFAETFIRKNFVLIMIILAVILEAFIVSAYTRKRVRTEAAEKTREAVLAEIKQGFEDYKADQSMLADPNKRTAAFATLKDAGFEDFLNWQIGKNLKTGDASLQNAIEAAIPLIADHIAGLRMDRGVTIDGCRTYIWGVDFTRLDMQKYGDLQSVLEGKIEGYTKDRGARPEDTELARELCTAYYHKEFPSKWSPDLEFAEINADGSVTARNELYTGSKTKFWRWGE